MSLVAARTRVSSRGSIADSEGGTLIICEYLRIKCLNHESKHFRKQFRYLAGNRACRELPSKMVVASSKADPCSIT